MGRARVVAALLVAVLGTLGGGPAWAAPTPRPSPTPEPPLPGQGPGGQPVGGPGMAARGVVRPAGGPALPAPISAHGWLVADLDTGEVLGARNPHGRYPPASTLKWLTALTLLPQFHDRSRKIACVDADVTVDGTRVGLVPRGRYTVDLLFQSMLMASGNDAANTLARVAGGAARTVAAMNAQARALQAYDTHAATPSGLDGPGQLTSAYDLALVARAALARADFRRYTGQRRGRIPAQGARYHAFEFANDNRLLYNYPGAFGGKNGFTDAARHTFIGAARHGGRRLVVTMMYGEHRPTNIAVQAGELLDWGFALPRTAAPVGTLVGPGPPAATPAAPGPPASPPAARAAGSATRDGGRPPAPAILGGVAALAVLAGAAATVAVGRRRR